MYYFLLKILPMLYLYTFLSHLSRKNWHFLDFFTKLLIFVVILALNGSFILIPVKNIECQAGKEIRESDISDGFARAGSL